MHDMKLFDQIKNDVLNYWHFSLQWDCNRLTADSLFVMGARANKYATVDKLTDLYMYIPVIY